ncbi:MFS transporter [Micromonospora sp. CPCC 205561]
MRHKLARTAVGHLRESLVPEGRDARLLGALHFADAAGKGVFLSGSAIYFTSVTGLSATQVGIGLSAAGASGFVASLLLGVAADRVGARRLLFAMLVAQSVGFALYPLVGGAAAFYALVTAVGFAEYGGGPAFGSIVASLFEPKDRVRVRAVLRSLFNLGFSLGSGVTALAVLLGGPAVRALPLVTCALLAGSAALTLRLPAGGTVAGPSTRWFGAVRDVRFMRVVALSAPLALHASIILVALPLWIVTQTDAPPVLVPILLVSNTVLVVLLQVRASRGAETVLGAASVARRSGLWLAGGCLLAAVAGVLGSVSAALLICVAMLLLTVAELQQAASAWGLAHGLAPESSQAEYLGAFNLHGVAQNVFGPALLVAALGATGPWGWVIVAAVAAVAALLIPGAAAAAQRVEPAPAAVR